MKIADIYFLFPVLEVVLNFSINHPANWVSLKLSRSFGDFMGGHSTSRLFRQLTNSNNNKLPCSELYFLVNYGVQKSALLKYGSKFIYFKLLYF